MKQKAVVNKQNTPPLTQRKIRLESVSMKINAVVAPPVGPNYSSVKELFRFLSFLKREQCLGSLLRNVIVYCVILLRNVSSANYFH